MTYNGWTNWETWMVYSWLTNEEGTYNYIMSMTSKVGGDYQTYDLSKLIREFVEEGNPLTTGMYADLLGGALREVDYYEIAEHFLEE